MGFVTWRSRVPCSLHSGRLSGQTQVAIKYCRLRDLKQQECLSKSGGWELSKIKGSGGCPLPGCQTVAFVLYLLVTEVRYPFLLGHDPHHEDSSLWPHLNLLPSRLSPSYWESGLQWLKSGLISWCCCWGFYSIREHKYWWARNSHYQVLLICETLALTRS